MSRRDDEELMAFLDGELPPRDAREVEARVDATVEDRRKVEALAELSVLVRGHYESETAAAEPGMAAAWAKLEAQLGAAPPEKATVPARAQTPRPGEQVGFWQSIVDAVAPRWSHIMTAAVGVAAGALLAAALRPPGAIHIVKVAAPVEVPVVAPVQPQVMAALAQDTEVDDLEVQSGTGMVFQVPSKNSEKPATTVIWVTDETTTEGPI